MNILKLQRYFVFDPNRYSNAGVDYSSVNKQVVYQAYSEKFSVSVKIHDDELVEEDESLTITICAFFRSHKFCFRRPVLITDNDGKF